MNCEWCSGKLLVCLVVTMVTLRMWLLFSLPCMLSYCEVRPVRRANLRRGTCTVCSEEGRNTGRLCRTLTSDLSECLTHHLWHSAFRPFRFSAASASSRPEGQGVERITECVWVSEWVQKEGPLSCKRRLMFAELYEISHAETFPHLIELLRLSNHTKPLCISTCVFSLAIVPCDDHNCNGNWTFVHTLIIFPIQDGKSV